MGRKIKRKSDRPKHGTRPPDMEVLTTVEQKNEVKADIAEASENSALQGIQKSKARTFRQWKIDLIEYLDLLQFYLTKTNSVALEIGSAMQDLGRATNEKDKAGIDNILDQLTELEVKKNKLDEVNKKIKFISNGDYFQGKLIEHAGTKELIEEKLRLLECAENMGTEVLVMKTTLLKNYENSLQTSALYRMKYKDCMVEYGRITQEVCVEDWIEEKTTDLPSSKWKYGTLLHFI